jgi:hypothetical protein
LIRRGYFFGLLTASLAAIAVATLVFLLITGTGRVAQREPEFALSFERFTLQELLNLDLEVDAETCGKVMDDPELELIKSRTVDIRGLPLGEPVDFRACPDAAIRYRLTESLAEEETMENLEAGEKMLKAMGLVSPGEDLGETLTDVYTEQIAGAYDTETGDITIVEGKGTGSLTDEITISHEVTHAIQDRNFDLEAPPIADDGYNGDNSLAVDSLVEGDAMLTMLYYAREYVDIRKLQDEEMTASEVSSEELEKAPAYIREALLFPYEEGLSFVMALDEHGGYEEVNRAFGAPPMSSEQIMHPEKYIAGDDPPVPVEVPDVSGSLGEGWIMLGDDSLGEFDLRVWFDEFTTKSTAREASEGWGGNTIQYYRGPGERYVLVNSFVWDTRRDAEEFFSGYRELLGGRFSEEVEEKEAREGWYLLEADGELFYCGLEGNGTLCVQAPDENTLKETLGATGGFGGP